MTDFCKRQKEIFQEHKLIQLEIDRLLSDVNGLLFKDALKKKYLEEGHDEEWADSVLNQITLTVSPLAKIEKEAIQSVVPAYEPIQSASTHDKTKYGFLGSRPLSKRKFVLNVVRQYVNENPKTYSEYAKIFNALRPDSLGVIRKYDSLPINQHRNYFMKEDECLNSQDGIKFVVCNQWGIFNIRPVVQFAIAQGYNVVEYNN